MKKIIFFAIILCTMPLFSSDINKDNTDKPDEGKMRIAVMDFEAKDIPSKDAIKYTELIRNDIVNSSKFIVIERSQMGQILKEQGFQQSGCTDVSCAVEIGKVLSAKKILVGSVMQIEDEIIITGRIVDVENGIVEFSEKSIAENKKNVVAAVSTFVERLTGRMENINAANADKKPFKKKDNLTVKDEKQSYSNPYSAKMIWSAVLTGTLLGGGYYFETCVTKTNDDISSLETKYNASTSITETAVLHHDIVSKQDKSEKYALYRNILYSAGGVSAILMGYYLYRCITYEPVKANVSDYFNSPLIIPVCGYNPDNNDRNADLFYFGASLSARF